MAQEQQKRAKRGKQRPKVDTYLSPQQQYLITLRIGHHTEPLKARITELTARVEELERGRAPSPPELGDIDLDSFLVDTSAWQ